MKSCSPRILLDVVPPGDSLPFFQLVARVDRTLSWIVLCLSLADERIGNQVKGLFGRQAKSCKAGCVVCFLSQNLEKTAVSID